MTLRLTARQIAMLAEMSIAWPSVVGLQRRPVRWIALTSGAPNDAEGRLLRNVMRAIENCLPGEASHLVISVHAAEQAPLQRLRQAVDPEDSFNLGVITFGADVSAQFLGANFAPGQIVNLKHCSLIGAHTLAELSHVAESKPLLWRMLCEAAAHLCPPRGRDALATPSE